MNWLTHALHLGGRCPPGWKLTRAVSEGVVDRALEGHLDGCERCASVVKSLCKLSATVQGFPRPPELGSEPRRVISARLLTAPPPADGRPHRRAGLLLAVGAGAAVLAVLASWGRTSRVAPHLETTDAPPPPALRSRASIRAIAAARFTRVQARPDEVVRLDEGTIVLEVAPLPRGERFRVLTRDAEVEVRGTRFQVSASGGELRAVWVTHGRVEVVSRGAGRAVLEPGDEWVPSATADPPSVSGTESRSPVGPRRSVAVRPRQTAAESAKTENTEKSEKTTSARGSFDRAWALLRQGDSKRAAEIFAEVERLAQGDAITEDALYWRAVATARTGNAAEARGLFGNFIARFPRSSRGGEAATALGWLLLDSGDLSAARNAFERGTRDPSPTVREGALDGLRRSTPP